MGIRRIAGVFVAFGLVLGVEPVAAQPIGDSFQLGLATELLSYTSGTVENDETGAEVDTSVTSWGIRESVALELGYAFSDALIVGALVALGGQSQTVEPDGGGGEVESSEFAVFLGPKLDYMFSAGSDVRPFVGAIVGITSTSGEAGTVETSATGFELVGRVGLRWFAAPRFSIDPAIAFGWATGGAETESAAGATTEYSVSGINFSILLAASGWL